MYKWMKTDTAAIMFTALQTDKIARICRFSAVLKQDEVNPIILKQAVYDLHDRFECFSYRLRKGFFWGWLEYTPIMPEVREESEMPAIPQWLGRNGGPEYRVLYYKRRITVEGSHVLGDGTGFTELLKAIVARYFELCGYDMSGCEGIKKPGEPIGETEGENAYLRCHTKEKLPTVAHDKAYQLPEIYDKDFLRLVFGIIPVDAIKAKSKPRGLTITEYLTSVLILALIRREKEPITDTVSIAVPANMRQFFETQTLRNFSSDMPVNYKPCGRRDQTLDEICDCVKGQLKSRVNKENLQAFVNSTFALTANPIIRAIPAFIKWPGLRYIQKKQHQKNMSVMLSNLGNIKLPDCMSSRLERIDLIGGDARAYGLTVFCSAASINGKVDLCFSLSNHDVSLPREFFRILVSDGIPLRVESSDATVSGAEAKRCPVCELELGEGYESCPICGSKSVYGTPIIEDVLLAPYPAHYEKPQKKSPPRGNISTEKVKAFFNI